LGLLNDSNLAQETPAAPTLDQERLRAEWAKVNLAALAALLNLNDDDRSFRELFRALRGAFGFDRALVLEHDGEGAHCVAAEPETLCGKHWPVAAWPNDLQVRATPAGHGPDTQRFQDLPADWAGPDEPSLSIPIGVNGRPALLVLVRADAGKHFSDWQIAVARQCATVCLATLLARKATELEAENSRLKAAVQHTSPGSQNTSPNGELLARIIDELPISLTVQDDAGRFMFANAPAAADVGMPAEDLIGSSPADFLSEPDAASRREWEQNLIRQNKTVTAETNVSDRNGQRTLMISHKPVRFRDRTFLISSSIDITERKQVERELLERSHIDKLTGLPDRVLVQECVERAIQDGDDSRRLALAFIDLDNFKYINDYYSHAVGDELLVKIGRRIVDRLRPGDMLARISGDEFLMLLDPFDSEEEIRSTIVQVLHDLKQPFHIEAFEIFSSCSIGVSIYPDHGRDYDTMRRNADSAMYQAKHEAKGDAIFFDLNMAQAVVARTRAEQRLRLAIRDRNFCCAFQPKVDIRNQQVVGFETLVRWRDEDGEIHPPSEFIGLAVELSLIDSITNFVLVEALDSIDRLDAAFGAETSISINVAAKQAENPDFMKSLAQTLRDSNRADRVIVELTEEAFVAKGLFRTHSLPMLREMGVRVSIDDFGTGYSSLSALADITADEIKIDRSFISGIHERPRNQSVLRAIESLAHALGMSIVAEGVETFEELAFLQAATRIRLVQGFYFAKPFYLEDMSDAAQVFTRGRDAARGQTGIHGRGAPSRLAAPTRSAGQVRSAEV
jgi:cyclic di-GMP phosphodiesterase Gmr